MDRNTQKEVIKQIFTVLVDLIQIKNTQDDWEYEEWRNDLPWPAEWKVDALRTPLDKDIVKEMKRLLNKYKNYVVYDINFSVYSSSAGDTWDGVAVLSKYKEIFEWFLDFFGLYGSCNIVYIDNYEDWVEEHRYEL